MLSAVAPETLARLRFPLGELTKPQVRALAAEAGLPVASKAESQDLCFLAGTGKAAFLARHAGLDDRPGEIVDRDGTVLALHRGAHHFTVGQRKGLGVAAPEPLYVLATDMGSNRVVAGPREALATTSVALRGARLHRAAGRGRRRQAALPLARRCPAGWPPSTAAAGSSWSCSSPSTAPRPGQTACLLRGDVVVGWGTIARTWPHLDSSPHGDDHRRDPRAVPLLLRAARPQAPAVVPAGPAAEDTSTLLIIAGMQPLKPYLSGREQPPHIRLTDAQKVFRTPDIEEVGSTSRHLTFFEMMGNFSIGDYFKPEAARFAWDLSIEGFGLKPDDIWVTVFEGDPELGIGLDEEAVDAWLEIGVPRERIVPCNRKENFWESGPTGLCGPCSELYLDRGVCSSARPTTCPAATTSASWSTGTSCSCSTTRSRATRSRRCRPRTSTPASGSSGSRRCCRASRACSRPTPSARWSGWGRSSAAAATARTSRPTARCASSPTTRAG